MVSKIRHSITHRLHTGEEWIFRNPKIVLSLVLAVTILFGIAGAFIGSYIAHGGLWGWLVAVVITVALLFGWDALKRRGV